MGSAHCRQWTMIKFITHEAIASGCFNREHCAATGSMAGWEDPLSNSDALLQLVLGRMDSDFAALHHKMRKPYTSREIDALIEFKTKRLMSQIFCSKFVSMFRSQPFRTPCNVALGPTWLAARNSERSTLQSFVNSKKLISTKRRWLETDR